MDKKVMLSIATLIIIGILILLINIFTQTPQDIPVTAGIQEQAESQVSEPIVEQKQWDFQEETTTEDQDLRVEDKILMN